MDEQGLTIVGYESAWLALLVASFILDNSKKKSKTLRITMEYIEMMVLYFSKENGKIMI